MMAPASTGLSQPSTICTFASVANRLNSNLKVSDNMGGRLVRLTGDNGQHDGNNGDEGDTILAEVFDAREMTLGPLYGAYLRRANLDQKTLAVRLALSGGRRKAKSWGLVLTNLHQERRRPRAEDLHLIAEELNCSRFDEQRLLRAADYYPGEAELRTVLADTRSWIETLSWPACFLDYRANILGWNAALATIFAVGAGAAGIDLRSSTPAAPRRHSEVVTAATHMLQALFDPAGFLHPLLAAPPYHDALRLCVFVLSYFEPLSIWPATKAWRSDIERSCRSFPHFSDLWDQAHSEWGAHLRGPHNAYGSGPLHNSVLLTLYGRRWRLLSSMLESDARLELLEFLPLGGMRSEA